MVLAILRVDFYGLTAVDVALVGFVTTVLIGAGLVLARANVGHPLFPYNRPCSPRRPWCCAIKFRYYS